MAQPVHALKPGQIRCNFDKTVSGLPCMRGRYLDKQCTQKQHLRPWSEIERIAVEHCELTGETLPDAFVDRKAEREANLQLWLVQYKLLGCRFGRATEAARLSGVDEDKARLFAEGALKHFKDEISAWMDEQAMPANEAVAMLARIARNEASQYYVVEGGELRLDVERMIADGNGDLIKGMKETKYGPVYELRDPDANLAAILDVHGLRRQKMEHTGAEGGMITVRYVDDHHSGLSGDNAD